MGLYHDLNAHAKSWWHHKELRKRGQHKEAREKERKSIRNDIKTIREALATPDAYVTVGGGGTVLHLRRKTIQNQTRQLRMWPAVDYLVSRRGVPCIMFTDDTPIRAIFGASIPEVGRTEDEKPATPMSYVTVKTYLDHYVKHGVTVLNHHKED